MTTCLSLSLSSAFLVFLAQGCASDSSPAGGTAAVTTSGASSGTATPDSSSSASGSSSGATSGPSEEGGSTTAEASTGLSGDGGTEGGQPGGGNDGGGATGCSGLPLCDDFESDTVGQPPSPLLWTTLGLAGCSGMGNPAAPPIFTIAVDDTLHHSGTNSVKIDTSHAPGGSGCGPWLVHTSAFAKLTGGEVYGRFYVHLSDTAMPVAHVALMALGLRSDGGVGFDVQNPDSFLSLACEHDGFTSNSLCWQRSDGNGVIPSQNAMGTMLTTYPTASGFTCIEFHTTASTSAIETWVNGARVSGLTAPPTPPGVTNWTPPSPLSIASLGFGWQVYSGPALTVWIDDVALSTTRIGCQ